MQGNSEAIVMLKSKHVALTALSTSDLSILFDWINDRELVVNNAPYRPVSQEQHHAWFHTLQERGDSYIFGIRLVASDKLIGSCQLHSVQLVHHSAELQIRIGDQQERSKGYGTEAVRLLLKFAFCDLNLHRVALQVFHNNLSAIRVYKKVGFVQEGVLRQAAYIDGEYVDIIMMGMLDEDYRP